MTISWRGGTPRQSIRFLVTDLFTTTAGVTSPWPPSGIVFDRRVSALDQRLQVSHGNFAIKR